MAIRLIGCYLSGDERDRELRLLLSSDISHLGHQLPEGVYVRASELKCLTPANIGGGTFGDSIRYVFDVDRLELGVTASNERDEREREVGELVEEVIIRAEDDTWLKDSGLWEGGPHACLTPALGLSVIGKGGIGGANG